MNFTTSFPYRLWRWTEADENLFDLTESEFAWFMLFVVEANK